MTMNEFNTLKKERHMTTEGLVVTLIKEKHPSVRKLGKGRYEVVDECNVPFIRTKGLRV